MSHLPAGVDPSTRKTLHLPNVETYNRWATTYDSDGNILQALDSYALAQFLLPRLLQSLVDAFPTLDTRVAEAGASSDGSNIYVTDLGCGTGRAIRALIAECSSASGQRQVAKLLANTDSKAVLLTGLDASPGMLKVAASSVPPSVRLSDGSSIDITLREWDILAPMHAPPPAAHAVVSTLVLEHLDVNTYFAHAARLVRPGGVLMVTNMHDEMGKATFAPPPARADSDAASAGFPGGAATRAGFNDPATNTKYRAEVDYAHTVEETVAGARKAGFELVGEVSELAVEKWMLDGADGAGGQPLLGPRGRKWLGIKCWFGMLFRRAV